MPSSCENEYRVLNCDQQLVGFFCDPWYWTTVGQGYFCNSDPAADNVVISGRDSSELVEFCEVPAVASQRSSLSNSSSGVEILSTTAMPSAAFIGADSPANSYYYPTLVDARAALLSMQTKKLPSQLESYSLWTSSSDRYLRVLFSLLFSCLTAFWLILCSWKSPQESPTQVQGLGFSNSHLPTTSQ